MSYRTSKIDKVKALVDTRGGWASVFSHFDGLSQAIKKGTKQQPCPSTGDGKTKFRFFKDWESTGGGYHNDVGALPDGIELLSWYENLSKGEVMDKIISILGGDITNVQERDIKHVQERKQQQSSPLTEYERKRRTAFIMKILRGAKDIEGSLAEVYLRSRGIKGDLSLVSEDLLYHPSLGYKEDDVTPWIYTPGMLSIVRDRNGVPLTLHRTFIKHDGSGKADVSRPKMLVQQPRALQGGYIELDKPVLTKMGRLIGISEGVENGLSIREATGCPMRVGMSDRIMEMTNFDDVDAVIVWADIEPSGAGLRAAKNIQERLRKAGKLCVIATPESQKEKIDWNDVYVEEGSRGFPLFISAASRVKTGVKVDEFKMKKVGPIKQGQDN